MRTSFKSLARTVSQRISANRPSRCEIAGHPMPRGTTVATHPVSRPLDNRSPSLAPVYRSVSCISNSSAYMHLFAHETSHCPSSLSGCRLGDRRGKLGEVAFCEPEPDFRRDRDRWFWFLLFVCGQGEQRTLYHALTVVQL
jgi:hypothetical protein